MKVLAKVRKLFALAGNNPSREEAEAAMLRAQELLSRHGLSMTDVSSPRESVDETILPGKRAVWWRRGIASVVARNFRCGLFLRSGRMVLVGLSTDAEVAAYVVEVALRTADREARRYVACAKRSAISWSRSRSRRLRNDFLRGYISGLWTRFQRNVEEHALVVVQPAEVREYLARLDLRKGVPSKTVSAGSLEARDCGHRAGRRFEYQRGVRGARKRSLK